MKYLSPYNEELFYKKEIPQNFIDNIRSELDSKYDVVGASKVDTDKSRGIYDRVKLVVSTEIGNIDISITSQVTRYRTENSWETSKFMRPTIKVVFYYNRKEMISFDTNSKEIKNADYSQFVDNIDHIIKKVISEGKVKKEREDFYGKITDADVTDLLVDISDTLGDPAEITKQSIKGNRGYVIIYRNAFPVLDMAGAFYYTPLDKMTTVVNDMNVLHKRVSDMYGLDMVFRFVDISLVIMIFDKKKK